MSDCFGRKHDKYILKLLKSFTSIQSLHIQETAGGMVSGTPGYIYRK